MSLSVGFEQGVSACVLKFADAGLLKSTAISLEAIEEMQTQALFEVWHCDSLEAALAGIFGFSRQGPLVAPSTTLEPAWVSGALQADVAATRSACPFLKYAQELPDFLPGSMGGRMRLSNPCIPQCPWPTLSRGSAMDRWRAARQFCLLVFRRHSVLRALLCQVLF